MKKLFLTALAAVCLIATPVLADFRHDDHGFDHRDEHRAGGPHHYSHNGPIHGWLWPSLLMPAWVIMGATPCRDEVVTSQTQVGVTPQGMPVLQQTSSTIVECQQPTGIWLTIR